MGQTRFEQWVEAVVNSLKRFVGKGDVLYPILGVAVARCVQENDLTEEDGDRIACAVDSELNGMWPDPTEACIAFRAALNPNGGDAIYVGLRMMFERICDVGFDLFKELMRTHLKRTGNITATVIVFRRLATLLGGPIARCNVDSLLG